ncbi:MAG: MBL fold metallo-hydrolase [Chloroflexota bacterium]
MNQDKNFLVERRSGEPYEIIKEKLAGSNAYLTSLLFHRGANFYVFSYGERDAIKHTFIDTGDSQYRDEILSLLTGNNINPSDIERIIITHRHSDHCGLADLLAGESRAKILVHHNFRSFVEGELAQDERRWLGNFNPSKLSEYDISYLPEADRSRATNIDGVDFPSLIEPIEIGEAGKLLILACPKSTLTHSPDQLIVFYSAGGSPYTREKKSGGFLPTDDMLFSGDLWLMQGPITNRSMISLYRRWRYGVRRMRNRLSGKGQLWRSPREQDAQAKEALKREFTLVRVKPGHGEEFMGSRIIPNSLLADSDLLLRLGYSSNGDKSILSSKHLLTRISALKEQAYAYFVKELVFWMELGYTLNDVSEFLLRIYKEQSGGGPLAEQDRRERRERMEATLTKLKNDKSKSSELRKLVEVTLPKLRKLH